jgi:ABC-type Fe3+ transport system permease subunit
MLKQAYIYAVAETLLLIFAIVIALGAAAIINMTIAAKEKADWQNGTPYMWKIALFSFITVCAVISICVSCSNLGLIISGYINPEYWVIHYIKTK